MNLAIITDQLCNYDGSEIYILECIKRWQEEMDISIYTSQFNEDLFEEFGIDEGKVSVVILPNVENDPHRFKLLDDLVIRPRTWERYIGQHDLYFQYLFPTQFVRKSPSIWFAAEPLRMLYDLHHHEPADESKISFHVYPRMQYETTNRADLNIVLQVIQDMDRNSQIQNLATNSQMMAGYLETIYNRKADLVAYPGINLPTRYGGPVDNSTALFVGRLWHHKRVDLIIQAIALLPHGNLHIVGKGPEKKRLKALAKSLGLKKRVKFLGNLSNKKLAKQYRSVTCGIYTPVREPFGIMPLEAASYGMPVVVTADGGYTEVLDHSCAYIVAPEPGKIANALNELFTNSKKAMRMGALARRKVENYTWDHTASSLLTLFNSTLRDQEKPADGNQFRPLLGAHYYPWYQADKQTRHWNENDDYATVTDLPVQGEYSSDDAQLITRHLALVEQAGLDYLVINLQITHDGLDKNELSAVDLLFKMAAESMPDLSLCFMLSYDKVDSETINESFAYLEDRYVSKENYLLLHSKPVIWYFISESFIGHFYHHYSELNESTIEYHRIAASSSCYNKYLPAHYNEFFDGWSVYSPLQVSSPSIWRNMWETSYQDFIEDNQEGCIAVFTISPGYDDTALTLKQRSNSSVRKVSRNKSKTYFKMQNACLELDTQPDLIVVTSFNEFHENTHIEPTEGIGDQYIISTHAFSEKLKTLGTKDPRINDVDSVLSHNNVSKITS